MAKTVKPATDRPKTTRTTRTKKTATPAIEVAAELPALSEVSEEAIAKLAFEYYCARGGQDGHALEDWLQAERTLTAAGG